MYELIYRKFEKRWADVFQNYPNAIQFNPLQFCPSTSLLVFPVFFSSSSIVLTRYFDISVKSMTIWSLLKLPKIAWPRPFNMVIAFSIFVLRRLQQIFFRVRCKKAPLVWDLGVKIFFSKSKRLLSFPMVGETRGAFLTLKKFPPPQPERREPFCTFFYEKAPLVSHGKTRGAFSTLKKFHHHIPKEGSLFDL